MPDDVHKQTAKLEEENQRLKQAVEELVILKDIAAATSSIHSLERIMALIIQKCVIHLKAEQGSVMLFTEESSSAPFQTVFRQFESSTDGTPYRFGDQLAGWMLKHKKALLCNDLKNDSRFSGLPDTFSQIHSLVSVPLRLKGTLMGIFNVFNKQPPQKFTSSDQRLIEIIAMQSAQIIENARLYEEEQALRALQIKQTELIQSEKMAALCDLVACIAHEINTPIGVLKSAGDISRRCVDNINKALETSQSLEQFKTDRSLQKSLQVLQQNKQDTATASDRIIHIVQSLKSFIHLDQAAFQKVDLHQEIENTLTLLTHELKDGILLTKEYGELPEIYCYPHELNQVFMNLFRNAAQAMAGQGTIHLKTSADKNYVSIQISDTGCGLAPDQLDRLFQPHFSKQTARVKAGLSLFTSHEVVQKHRGEIKVDSEVGKGATFTIVLPVDLNIHEVLS